ncbi:MAG: transposase [Woeseiaceae bacterium]|nr:transposase [Woeseiaceae bacterium]
MPRFQRLVVPGFPHHVTQRGVRRQTTFFDEQDYRRYLNLARDLLDGAAIEILAYCLMPNHIHAVVVPEHDDSLANYFGPLHKRYAQHTNLRYEWAGHLWQARFYSVAMAAGHTLAAMRYVELNPVRSGLVDLPEQWPWSSARGNLGLVNDVLVPARRASTIVEDWQEFLAVPESQTEITNIRRHTQTGRPDGDVSFINEVESITGRRVRIRKPGRKRN